MAVMFGVLYGFSCITKLWGNFYVLLLGRLLGGISTSLLFSVFESWMIYEHHKVTSHSRIREECLLIILCREDIPQRDYHKPFLMLPLEMVV